jgi:hypothetical protein
MADTDLLPARGVPALALVDSTGIASNGSQTVAQLAARGIRSVCAVDANGISLSGASVAQLASAGIRAFCPVDENGLAQDAVSTADILRRRGIRPMVLLNNTGVALTGSANVATLAQRGLQAFCPVDEAGNATTMGAVILVSNTTVLDTATIGSNVGTLSVAGGTGTYTFTLTSNPGSLFATAGTNGVNLNVAAALTAGIKPITVQAAGGVPTPISRTINITVNQSPTLPVNTVAPVIAGTPQEGQTLTVTNNGTWTGFPAPGFTYQWNRNPPAPTPPPGVTGLIGWWDASVTASLTLAGSTVQAIADQSGGGNTMVYDGIHSSPTYQATGFNGRPTMSVGGWPLTKNSFPMGTGNTLTAFWVGVFDNTSNNFGRLISYSAGAVDTGNINSWTMLRNSSGSNAVTYRNAVFSGQLDTAYGNCRIISTIDSSGVLTIYVNGVASTTATASGNWTTGGHLCLGVDFAGTSAIVGRISEAGVATGYSNAAAVALLDSYLKTKWGL